MLEYLCLISEFLEFTDNTLGEEENCLFLNMFSLGKYALLLSVEDLRVSEEDLLVMIALIQTQNCLFHSRDNTARLGLVRSTSWNQPNV